MRTARFRLKAGATARGAVRTALSFLFIALSCVPYVVPASAAAAQNGGTIAGALVTEQGRPVRRATVKLTGGVPATTRTATSDANGRFVFPGLPQGIYRLSASKPGFIETSYGAKRPGSGVPGTPITLGGDQRVDDIVLRLARGGVISGTVTDEFGDAAYAVPVRAMRLGYAGGGRAAQPAANTVTDDLGGYRLAGLPPGDYMVSANFPPPADSSAAGRGYVPVYFGGTVAPSAAAHVAVGVGRQVPNIDIQLQAMRTSTIAGSVTGPEGVPTGARLQLVDPAMPVANVGVWFRYATRDGRFSFPGLTPGSYVLNAQAPGGAAGGTLTGSITVPVEGESVEVTLPLRRGTTVSGRLDLTTVKGAADVRRLRVTLDPVASASDWETKNYQAAPDADGRFAIGGVPRGLYRVLVSGLPAGVALDTARFGARDAADVHLQVEPGEVIPEGTLTFTDRTGEISGFVKTPAGGPAVDWTVLIFPADETYRVPESRRIQVTQSRQDGHYTVRGLPAGDYRIAVVDVVEPGQQYDPGFLAGVAAGAASATLSAGGRATADLSVR